MDETINEPKRLLEHFEQCVIERERVEADSKRANPLFHEIHGTFQKLREMGELHLLGTLLDHDSVAVRNFAAKYYLLVDEKKALKALGKLAQLDGIDGFAAQNLIDRWKSGDLTFDY